MKFSMNVCHFQKITEPNAWRSTKLKVKVKAFTKLRIDFYECWSILIRFGMSEFLSVISICFNVCVLYVILSLCSFCDFSLGIQIRFRTFQRDGLLLFAASPGNQDEMIVLQFRAGRPWLIFDPQGIQLDS